MSKEEVLLELYLDGNITKDEYRKMLEQLKEK
jgi:uncharacterized membrane protein